MRLLRTALAALTLGTLGGALAGCGGGATSSGSSEWAKASLAAFPTVPLALKGDPPKEQPPPPPPPPPRGNGTLKGRVRLLGDAAALLREAQADHEGLLNLRPGDRATDEEKDQQRWRISADGGVANVVVWLRPAAGDTWAVDVNHPGVRAVRGQEIELDMPGRVFRPHVLILFPRFRTPGGLVLETEQTFYVLNSSALGQDFRTAGLGAGDVSRTLRPRSRRLIQTPQPLTRPVQFSSITHPHMSAYVWVMDHPYYALTDRDGNFEIKDVPTGRVRLVAWHEDAPNRYLTDPRGEEIEIGEGENRKDLTLQAK